MVQKSCQSGLDIALKSRSIWSVSLDKSGMEARPILNQFQAKMDWTAGQSGMEVQANLGWKSRPNWDGNPGQSCLKIQDTFACKSRPIWTGYLGQHGLEFWADLALKSGKSGLKIWANLAWKAGPVGPWIPRPIQPGNPGWFGLEIPANLAWKF